MGLPGALASFEAGAEKRDTQRLERGSWPMLIGATALAIVGFVVGFRPISDMDFHWHLAMGRADLALELDESRDPFTHLPIVRSVDLGYRGGDRLFALVDRAAGLRGVRVLCALAVVALYLQAFRLGVSRTGTAAAGALVAAAVAALSFERIQHRPDLFAIFFVFLLVQWLGEEPSWKNATKIFALSALWANVHPSAPLAPTLALASSFGAGWRRLGSALAAAAGVCMTPHGPFFTFALLRDTAAVAPLIPEWQALWNLGAHDFPSPLDFAGVWLRLGIVIGVVAWGAAGQEGATTTSGERESEERPGKGREAKAAALSYGLMGLGAIGLALTSFRLFYLMGLSVLWAVERHAGAARASRRLRAGMVVLASLLLVLFPLRDRWRAAAAARSAGLSVWADLYEPSFPVAAAAYLGSHDLRGNLFHRPEWGGYLECELWPRYRSAFDGRVSLFGPTLSAELLEFVDARRREDLVQRFALEILVLPLGTLSEREIARGVSRDDPDRRWLRVQGDGVAEVFVDQRGKNWEHNRLALRDG